MKKTWYRNCVCLKRFDQTTACCQMVSHSGQSLAGGACFIDVPIEKIPTQYRQHGATFEIEWCGVWPEDEDAVEELRSAARDAIQVIDKER